MNADWYQQLATPPLTPPDAVFGPVWGVLYVMIAAGILTWARIGDKFLPGVTWKLILLHLLANAAWSVLFFQFESPGLALLDILLLLATLLTLQGIFWRECRLSYYLLCPYFLWVMFATYLNAGFWWLNRAG